MNVAISGAGGFVGGALSRALRRDGVTVLRIARGADADIRWDPVQKTIDARALDGADAVVNLAGAPIARRWTAARKREIRESRVTLTSLIARAVASQARPPAVLVSASAIGYYGDRGDEVLTEASAPGSGFLAGVVCDWEAATSAAQNADVRTVVLRTGIVLARHGGALAKMVPPFWFGVGGPLGHGRQWMSWIALDDAVRAIRFVMERDVRGAVNVVAPQPVTNAEFSHALGRALSRPAFVRAPAFTLRALFGEMASETALASQRVMPARLVAAGFTFDAPALDGALDGALRRALHRA